MKKIRQLTFLLLLCLCLIVAGCSPSGSTDSTEATSILDVYEENISVGLYQKVPTMYVSVTDNNGRYNLSVDIRPNSTVANFGIYILEVQKAFEEAFPEDERGYFSVTLSINNDATNMIWFSSDDYAESTSPLSGTLYDNRSGEFVAHSIDDVDKLCELYPATSSHIAKGAVDQDDLRIYEEVMDILNAQPDRTEDEILEEIAPDYGMTAAELKQFMVDTMSKIYSAGSDSSP